jgi:Alpha 1,4-glycosyltransferase conserved region
LAITHYVKRLGLADCIQAREVFYPVSWQQAAWIFDPTISLESIVKPNTCAIHLWNTALKDRKAPPGSFVNRLYREGA